MTLDKEIHQQLLLSFFDKNAGVNIPLALVDEFHELKQSILNADFKEGADEKE